MKINLWNPKIIKDYKLYLKNWTCLSWKESFSQKKKKWTLIHGNPINFEKSVFGGVNKSLWMNNVCISKSFWWKIIFFLLDNIVFNNIAIPERIIIFFFWWTPVFQQGRINFYGCKLTAFGNQGFLFLKS